VEERQQSLLEREAELASLASLIGEAAEGRARVALVEGPAGIGKSRLLAEMRGNAEGEGYRVLGARGSELEREFPFGVVRQLFEPLLADAELRELALAEAAAPAKAVFETPEGNGDASDAVDPSFAALHGLYWLTVNLASERPLLLAIDDLHWCDASSLRFVAYLARRLEGLDLLVATTLRPAEPGADAALLGEIANDPLSVAIHPAPLGESSVAELVKQRLGDGASADFCNACHEATGGNPLLLHELLRTLEAERVEPDAAHVSVVKDLGPRAASRSVLVRLARLPADAVSVARAAAVLGDGAEVGILAQLAGLSPEDAAKATRDLAQAEILRPEAPVGFVHPLVQAAVYSDLPPGERELQHERAAELFRESGAAAEQVAAHLLALPPKGEEWRVEVLQEAGRTALGKGGTDSAVAYLQRALDEPPPAKRRNRVLLELGLTATLQNAPAAIGHLREAYEVFDDPVTRVLIANVLGRALIFNGAPAEAVELVRDAATDLPDELGDMRLSLEALELVTMMFAASEPVAARERVAAYRDRAPGDEPGAKMMAAAAALDWTYAGGPADDCADLALKALEGGTMFEADGGLIWFAAVNTLVFANRREVEGVYERALRDAHAVGSLIWITGITLWHGWALLREGELPDAERSLRASVEHAKSYGSTPLGDPYTYSFLAAVLLEQGKVAEARRTLDLAEDPGNNRDGAMFWLQANLEILAAEGKDEQALECADEIQRRRPDVTHPGVFPWRSPKAEVLDRMGRTDEAIALMKEDLELAREIGAPRTLGRTLRILGQLERQEGMEHLKEAVEVLDGAPARLELAKALCALGTAIRLGRKPSDAREPLQRAIELATACGAEPVVERARSELYATGARPRRDALKGVESLTPSERRVADLAAEGNSNREIAQTLFVTPKTVEVHLSNTYRKLEIKGRRELPAALAAA
jgi:DNA-binding CsgD family transcriptional regulator